MRILVDSTIWIDYFNGVVSKKTDYLDELVGKAPIVVGDLILSEVLQGFRKESEFKAAQSVLSAFPLAQIGGREVAIQSARNYRTLRKQGITVRKTIDCLIATFCILNSVSLLHSDRDFDPFEKHLNLKCIVPD